MIGISAGRFLCRTFEATEAANPGHFAICASSSATCCRWAPSVCSKTQLRSACAIFSGQVFGPDGEPLPGTLLLITAETDEAHYPNREPPGAMHADTDALLRWAAWNNRRADEEGQ